jgi:predicted dienelactone hydrolase
MSRTAHTAVAGLSASSELRRSSSVVATVVAAAALLIAPLAVALPATASATPVAPAPTGGQVGSTDLRFVDTGRPDPFAPGTSRSVTVTITYPTKATGSPGPYLGVPAGDLMRRGITNADVDTNRGALPLILFSPGYFAPRFAYSGLTEDLASRGYVVVSMDHTGEPLATVEPNGNVIGYSAGADSYSDAGLRKSIDARSADASFMIDVAEDIAAGTRITDADGRALPKGLAKTLDPDRVGMFGHSIGGATTTEVLLDDRRLDAAVNVDGALLYGNSASRITTTDPKRPLLSILNSQHADSADGRARFWNAYLRTPRSVWHREYSFLGAGHFSFSDLQAVVPQWVPDVPGTGGPAGLSLGTAPRAEVIAATRDLVSATFDRFLKSRPRGVLENPTSTYPIVVPMSR